MRGGHPDKEVEDALRFAEIHGWKVEQGKGQSKHAWGSMYCLGKSGRGQCRASIWSTPRVPQDHAKELRRRVLQCPCGR
ncbi:MAG: hypothetical protein M5U22_18445 [Thermoleophilia bacterium]|nr:hypothetical protein [Thermoleophilia bacterium]